MLPWLAVSDQVEEIHTTLRKHLRKEEEQLLPLLLAHFTPGEQAQLVAQFLCSIPLSTVEVGAALSRCACSGILGAGMLLGSTVPLRVTGHQQACPLLLRGTDSPTAAENVMRAFLPFVPHRSKCWGG
jgi:hypothetical protein